MVEELKVALEVKKEDNGWISNEKLSKAILDVMSNGTEIGEEVKKNHAKWKKMLSCKDTQETIIDTFIKNLETLL